LPVAPLEMTPRYALTHRDPRRTLRSVAALAFLAPLALGGCQRHAPQTTGAQPNGTMPGTTLGWADNAGAPATVPVSAPPIPQVPAPFASPPMLPGTPDVAALVAKIKPAVVNITTVHETRAPRGGNFPFGLDPFGGMIPGDPRGGDQVFKQKALGSGFLVDSKGHVVTNAHVVEGADTVRVRLADDREFDAKVRGRDARLDLAVLELVGADNLPMAAIGSSDALRVGEYVVAIGNPFGLGHTVTMGIVSAKDRAIGAGPYDDFIQTDASINPGNSGGPLFNLKGEVVGINTAINPNGKGIGFAIPSDALKEVLGQLIATGHVARGRLGVVIQQVDDQLSKALKLGGKKGALVAEVEPGSPADRAGLRAGDVVVTLDGSNVNGSEELPRLVARHAPGTSTRVGVVRDGAAKTFDVTVDELKDEGPDPSRKGHPSSDMGSPSGLGIAVADASGGGVAVREVLPGGASDGNLAPGDVIYELNGAPVRTTADLMSHLKKAPEGRPLLLKVKRGGNTRFVAIERRDN
jgi:serine protease Do